MTDGRGRPEIGEGGEVDPRRLLPVLAAVACACVVATLVVTMTRSGEQTPADRAPRPPARRQVAAGPAAILAAWDERRAAAWAEGDAEALAGLYADGSRTGSGRRTPAPPLPPSAA